MNRLDGGSATIKRQHAFPQAFVVFTDLAFSSGLLFVEEEGVSGRFWISSFISSILFLAAFLKNLKILAQRNDMLVEQQMVELVRLYQFGLGELGHHEITVLPKHQILEGEIIMNYASILNDLNNSGHLYRPLDYVTEAEGVEGLLLGFDWHVESFLFDVVPDDVLERSSFN